MIEIELHDKSISEVFERVKKSKKVIVLTGAGISCNAGIPDFRSASGLYNKTTNTMRSSVKMKDLFDISLFCSEELIENFSKLMSKLYEYSMDANPTKTHYFISKLASELKLLRCYTQNIDGIEAKLGLNMDLDDSWKALQVVQLHGDIRSLSCMNCSKISDWTQENKELMKMGDLPECPHCQQTMNERIMLGKRKTGQIGRLRPNIVLYGENHSNSETLTKGLNKDLRSNPDLFLIMGTSLKVHGVQKVVKSMAKAVHEKNGIVILVNKTKVSGWQKIIDYQIQCDCDEFCQKFQTFEKSMKSKIFATPPTTPKKGDRIIDVLSTPTSSSAKKRNFTIYQDSFMSPDKTPKKMKENRVFKERNGCGQPLKRRVDF